MLGALKFFLAAVLASFVVACGGGGGGGVPTSSTVTTLEQTIDTRFGASPNQLLFARAVANSAGTLLQASASTKSDAQKALISYSVAVDCAAKPLTSSDTSNVQTDVFSLVFNDAAKRAKLQQIYTVAGPFELNTQDFAGAGTC